MNEPYYSDDHVTIYHGDCLELADLLRGPDGRWLKTDTNREHP